MDDLAKKRAIRGLEHIGDLSTPNMRLVKARIDAGFISATSAADALNFKRTTLQQHENGIRALSKDAAVIYALAFGTTPAYLLYGPDSNLAPKRQRIALVGVIEQGGKIVMMSSQAAVPKTVESPLATYGDGLQALLVVSDDLHPAYRKDDVVFFSADSEAPIDASADGKECVVKDRDGNMLLRIVHRTGTAGEWLLSTYQPSIAPTRKILVEAHPILWVRRGPVQAE